MQCNHAACRLASAKRETLYLSQADYPCCFPQGSKVPPDTAARSENRLNVWSSAGKDAAASKGQKKG